MEAVRLGLPLEVTRAIKAYASDRVGLHPTARIWDEVVDRIETESDFDRKVVWREVDDDIIQVFIFSFEK